MSSEPIKLQVSLGPNGLRVHLPSGRTLDISASESGARFLEQMLKDAEAHRRYDIQQRGYIGAFPTQEIAAMWEREERNKRELAAQVKEHLADKEREREREVKARWEAKGISLDAIKVNI